MSLGGPTDPWGAIRAKRYLTIGAMAIWFLLVGAIGCWLTDVSKALAFALQAGVSLALVGAWVSVLLRSVCPNCGGAYGIRWPVLNGPFDTHCRWCGIKFEGALEAKPTSDTTDTRNG